MPDHGGPCDALIIGGGVIGLACAERLARDGARVTLLERGVCGREASWAGAGIIQSGSWHRRDPLVQLQRESVRMYPAWTADLHERTGVDPQFIPCGSLEPLLTDQQFRMAASEVRAAEACRAEYGLSVLELLTLADVAAREPELTRDLLGAQYSAVTGQVRNPLLLDALRAAARLSGIRVLENREVVGLLRDGERVTGARTLDERIESRWTILAAGAWSSRLDPRLETLTPVYPVRGQMVLLEMPSPPLRHVIERGRCYIVPRVDGRILVGATEEHASGYEKRNTAEGVAGLLSTAQQLVPCLAGATLVRSWAGLRPGTPDRAPYIGPVPGFEGLIAACGHFRSGLVLAPVTAHIVAEIVGTGRTQRDLARVAPGRELKKTDRNDDLDRNGPSG